MSGVKPVAEVRRANLDRLIARLGSMEALAEAAGTSSVYLSQIRNRTPDAKTGRPREMGSQMAQRLCAAAGMPEGWMDCDHDEARVEASQPAGWPFKRLTRDQWEALGELQAVVEDAAVTKARELLEEVSALRKVASRKVA